MIPKDLKHFRKVKQLIDELVGLLRKNPDIVDRTEQHLKRELAAGEESGTRASCDSEKSRFVTNRSVCDKKSDPENKK